MRSALPGLVIASSPLSMVMVYHVVVSLKAPPSSCVATKGTADAVSDVDIDIIRKVSQGSPNIRDAMLNGEVAFLINTPSGKQSADDGYIIRRLAVELGIPYVTTIAAANAVLTAIEEASNGELTVKSLNEYAE